MDCLSAGTHHVSANDGPCPLLIVQHVSSSAAGEKLSICGGVPQEQCQSLRKAKRKISSLMARTSGDSKDSLATAVRLCKLQMVALEARSLETGKRREAILLALADKLLAEPGELTRFQSYIEETLWRLEECKDAKVLKIASPAPSILRFLSYRMGFEGALTIVVNAMIDFYLLDPLLESLHRPKDAA
jgi:hypothetical protein